MAMTEIFPNFYRINLPIPRGGFESFLDGWLIEDKAGGRRRRDRPLRFRSFCACLRPKEKIRSII